MKRFIYFMAMVLLLSGVCLGCNSDKSDKTGAAADQDKVRPATEPVNIKPVEEYEKEAKEQINEDNAEEELERLKKELEAEG